MAKTMEFRYLPALTDQSCRWMPIGVASSQFLGHTQGARVVSRRPQKTTPLQELRCLNWMDAELKDTNAYYPHTLITYYYFRPHAFQLPSEAYIFGDCGGYSLRRYGMTMPSGIYSANKNILQGSLAQRYTRKIDPLDVIRWQSNTCTAGALIDLPPVDINGKRIYEQALETTVKNTKRALPTYEAMIASGNPFCWWGVAHGWTEEHLTHWWKRIKNIYPFDGEGEGWSFSARSTNRSFDPVGIARVLRFIDQKKIKRAHFFAAAGSAAIPTIIALGQRTGLEFVSCDATSPYTQAMNRAILLDAKDGLGYTEIEEKKGEIVAQEYLIERCGCISCDHLRKDLVEHPDVCALGDYGEYWLYRFMFHNHIVYLEMVRNIEKAAREAPDAMLRTVLGTAYGATLRGLDGTEPSQVATGMPRSLLEGLD